VCFEMDVFWVFHAGQDPAKLLAKYPKRWALMHLKDIRKGAVTGLHTGSAPPTDNVTIGTGQIASVTLQPGECAEIATGAPMPPGADAVVIVEETEGHGDAVRILTPVYPKQNVGRQGADIQQGQTILRAGDFLAPAKVGALAALGTTDVDVVARPRVAILSTGNEVIEPGQPLSPGQIFDVNRFTLGAIVSAHGGVPEPYRPAQDTIDALVDALDACMTAAALLRCVIEALPFTEPLDARASAEGGILGSGSINLDLPESAFRPDRPSEQTLARALPRRDLKSTDQRTSERTAVRFACPIPGCSKVFVGSRGGWERQSHSWPGGGRRSSSIKSSNSD